MQLYSRIFSVVAVTIEVGGWVSDATERSQIIALPFGPLLPTRNLSTFFPGRLDRHQLQDRKIRLLILSHSLNAEARLLRQQRVRILRAPFAAKVHHEQVERAVLDGARRLLRNEILGDPRVGCAGLAQVAEDGDAGLVGPVVEDAADLVDECACLLQIS